MGPCKLWAFFLTLLFFGCVEDLTQSPEPGVLRVFLTNKLGSFQIKQGDILNLYISRIRVYRANGDYADIYRRLDAYVPETDTVNIFAMEQGRPRTFLLGEAYLPPELFVEISLTVRPASEVYLEGQWVPVVMPDSINGVRNSPLVRLDHEFRITEHDTTEIRLLFDTDASLFRQRDTYAFKPTLLVQP